MMGRGHALSGIAAWTVAAPAAATVTHLFTLTPATYAVGAILCAGAALAPDLDHPGNSSASNALKPLTTVLSNVVAAVSFGHRKGTHSLLGIAVFTLGTLLASNLFAPWGPLLIAFLLSAFTWKALRVARIVPAGIGRRLIVAALAVGTTVATYLVSGADYGYLLFAVGFGVFLHILGDAITIGGVPWFWPLSQRNFRLGALSAGGPTERFILSPLFVVIIVMGAFFAVRDHAVFGYPLSTAPVASTPATTTTTAPPTTRPTATPSPTASADTAAPAKSKKAKSKAKKTAKRT